MRPLVPLLALLAIAGALAGLFLDPPAALLLSATVGTAAGMLLVWAGNQRIEQLWTQLRAGLAEAPAHDPSDIGWRRLGAAVGRLMAEHQSMLARQQESPPALEVVDSMIEPALLFDEDDVLVAANEAATDLLGISELGIRSNQALGSSAFAGAVTEARGLRRPVHVDAEVGGRELSAVVTMVEDQALVIVSDRTRERQVEALRRDFVVNASHELKTPVTSIVTLAEALEVVVSHPGNEERASDLVRRLGEEAERMSTLVHDLLDLRRLEESGPVEVVAVDVVDAARAVVDELRETAENRQVTVSVEANGTAVVAAEVDDVHTMLRNLVRNAIQYNRPGGRVWVIVKPSGSHVEVRVNDTGIGLTQLDIPRIFERFYRVDAARSRDAGGTGLGLSLVRHAVERHGGTVQVDSLLGEGSTFTVVLPVSPS